MPCGPANVWLGRGAAPPARDPDFHPLTSRHALRDPDFEYTGEYDPDYVHEYDAGSSDFDRWLDPARHEQDDY